MKLRPHSAAAGAIGISLLLVSGALALNVLAPVPGGRDTFEAAGGPVEVSAVVPRALQISDLRGGPAFSGPPLEQVLTRTLTLDDAEITLSDLEQKLSERLGARLAFSARAGSNAVAVDFKHVPSRDLIEALSRQGAVGTVSDGEIFLLAQDIDAPALSQILSRLFERTISVVPKKAGDRVSLELRRVSIRDALPILERFGGLTLTS